jgi:hypothetical protein
MGHSDELLYFGPYRLVRRLADSAMAERWLALHERNLSSHVVHRFRACRDKHEQRRVMGAIEAGLALNGPHLLPIELFSLSISQRPCAVTPYTGNHEGLLTLSGLLEAKSGRMPAPEAERAMMHLLEAARFAHGVGMVHGEIGWQEVMVDRHGSCAIEFYGLDRRLRAAGGAAAEIRRDEIRSIVEIGYRLLTGIDATEPRIDSTRLVKRLDRAWDEFFDVGLDAAGGFGTASEAIELLPSSARERERQSGSGAVRVVLNRFRWASTPRSG